MIFYADQFFPLVNFVRQGPSIMQVEGAQGFSAQLSLDNELKQLLLAWSELFKEDALHSPKDLSYSLTGSYAGAIKPCQAAFFTHHRLTWSDRLSHLYFIRRFGSIAAALLGIFRDLTTARAIFERHYFGAFSSESALRSYLTTEKVQIYKHWIGVVSEGQIYGFWTAADPSLLLRLGGKRDQSGAPFINSSAPRLELLPSGSLAARYQVNIEAFLEEAASVNALHQLSTLRQKSEIRFKRLCHDATLLCEALSGAGLDEQCIIREIDSFLDYEISTQGIISAFDVFGEDALRALTQDNPQAA